jgi:hypothetical protein
MGTRCRWRSGVRPRVILAMKDGEPPPDDEAYWMRVDPTKDLTVYAHDVTIHGRLRK